MSSYIPSSYRRASLFSFLLHLVIIIALLLKLPLTQHKSVVDNQNKHKVVKAIAINSQAVEQEISRVREQRKQRALAEKRKQQQYQDEIEKMQQKRRTEILELKKIQKQRQQAEQEKKRSFAKHQARLQKLKFEKDQLKRNLHSEKERLTLEKNKLAALQKELSLKEKMLKKQKEEAAHLAEQKKQAEIERQRQREKVAKQKEEQLADEKKRQQTLNQVDKYKTLIINAISQNWIIPPNTNKNLSCKFEIMLSINGEVLSVKLIKGSGDPLLDRSAQSAIYKASPLPVPSDKEIFQLFKTVQLTVKPEDVQQI
jgi:colicin import membrane protein